MRSHKCFSFMFLLNELDGFVHVIEVYLDYKMSCMTTAICVVTETKIKSFIYYKKIGPSFLSLI